MLKPPSHKLTTFTISIVQLMLLVSGNISHQNTYASTSEGRASSYPAQEQRASQVIEVGTEVRREIAKSEVHSYSIKDESDRNYRLVIESDIELMVAVIKPNGTNHYTIRREVQPAILEIFTTSDFEGLYYIEVQSVNTRRGQYKLRIEQIATDLFPNSGERNNLRHLEEIQAQTEKKKIRVERSQIDSRIREETARPLHERLSQPKNESTPSLFDEYKATTEKYNAIRDPAEEDAKFYTTLSGTHRTVLGISRSIRSIVGGLRRRRRFLLV